MNEVINTILNRVSLRRYMEKDIEPEKVDLIIESMKRAPTAGNMQMYSIIVVEDQKLKDTLSETCDNQKFISKAPLVMIIVADLQKWFDYYHYEDCETYCKENDLEFKGPQESDLMLAIEDAMCASENGVIAAESLGIGSCYIGDILENYEIHKDLLELPKYVFPISMLTFGYYPEDFKKHKIPRFDNEFMVFKNKYQKVSKDKLKEMFSPRENKFREFNKAPTSNYAQMMYSRKTNSEFSREMARSVKVMLTNFNGVG